MRIFIKGILHFIVLIVYRVKKVGEKNVPEKDACIIAPNHVHALDSATIVLTAKRQIRFMAKEELYKNPILKWLAKVFGIFPVKRGGNDIEAIKTSLRILKNNEVLGIFPEGTRNGMAKHEKAKSGAIMLAIKSGAPIIPVGIQGSFKPFTKVKINYGKPIYYKKYDNEKLDKDLLNKLTQELMEEIVRLTNEKI